MLIGTDPWALTELAKAGGPGGCGPQPRGVPRLGNLASRSLGKDSYVGVLLLIYGPLWVILNECL